MPPLSIQNIESELSYSYLHAVAASTGATVTDVNRHLDNAGIDARLTAWGPFINGGYLNEVDLNIQLKATTQVATLRDGCFSYELQGIARYDDLRTDTQATPRILVVLFLPKERDDWLDVTEQMLSLRKCAYWVSLRGAPQTLNKSSVTVSVPERQTFHPAGLTTLCSRLSRRDFPVYGEA